MGQWGYRARQRGCVHWHCCTHTPIAWVIISKQSRYCRKTVALLLPAVLQLSEGFADDHACACSGHQPLHPCLPGLGWPGTAAAPPPRSARSPPFVTACSACVCNSREPAFGMATVPGRPAGPRTETYWGFKPRSGVIRDDKLRAFEIRVEYSHV